MVARGRASLLYVVATPFGRLRIRENIPHTPSTSLDCAMRSLASLIKNNSSANNDPAYFRVDCYAAPLHVLQN